MDSETRVEVENLICNWNGSYSADDASAELLSYQGLRDSESRMLKQVLNHKVLPLTFSAGLTQAVAVPAFSSACLTAACERSLSAQSFVHPELRYGLRGDRVVKLVYVFFHRNNMSEKEDEEFFNDIDELV